MHIRLGWEDSNELASTHRGRKRVRKSWNRDSEQNPLDVSEKDLDHDEKEENALLLSLLGNATRDYGIHTNPLRKVLVSQSQTTSRATETGAYCISAYDVTESYT